MKINGRAIKKAIKTAVGAIAIWQFGEVCGAYKALRRINKEGAESDKVKDALGAARNIEKGIESLKDTSWFGKKEERYDPDEVEEEFVSWDELTDAAEDAADVVEETTVQPED